MQQPSIYIGRFRGANNQFVYRVAFSETQFTDFKQLDFRSNSEYTDYSQALSEAKRLSANKGLKIQLWMFDFELPLLYEPGLSYADLLASFMSEMRLRATTSVGSS